MNYCSIEFCSLFVWCCVRSSRSVSPNTAYGVDPVFAVKAPGGVPVMYEDIGQW